MPTYHAFGGSLESEIEFPELQPSPPSERPDWRLRVSTAPHVGAPGAPDTPDAPGDSGDSGDFGELLGEDHVEPTVTVRSYRAPTGYRLRYQDTGVFEVSADGREIVWSAAAGASIEAARMDVLGRVLSVALHAGGRFALHGSGVAIDGHAVGFLAPKFSGKSTLALALVNAGAELLSDDTLPVDLEPAPNAWPGVHTARVFQDSAQRLALVEPVAEPGFTVKHTVATVATPRIRSCPAPLAALYLLAPTPPNVAATPAERTLVTSFAATVELVRHAKVGALLGHSEAGRVLDRAAVVASRVPVYRLDVVRDFAQLDLVVGQILRWHSDS